MSILNHINNFLYEARRINNECATTGLAAQVKEYTMDNDGCHDTPTNPDLAMLPFLSFRAGVQGGVPPGKQWYLCGEGVLGELYVVYEYGFE